MSRFKETLQRDLIVIADRATPSPDAWATIQERIADQDPPRESEIIMLTENTTHTRGWQLFVAAAVIGVVVTAAVIAVFVGTGGDGDQLPASPPPTATPAPEPDQAEPNQITTAPRADTSEPDTTELPGPRQLALVGTLEGFVVFDERAADGTSAFHGTEAWSGDVIGNAATAGTSSDNDAGDGLVGTSRRILTVDVDGVGEGVIIIDDQWQSLFAGTTESTGTVLGGTGDFAGASGSFLSSTPNGLDDPETPRLTLGGEYTLEIVVPPVDAEAMPTDTLALVGTSVGEMGFDAPADGPAVMTGTEDFTGDLVGSSMLSGYATRTYGEGQRGFGIRVLDVTTRDGRSGLIVTEGDWTWDYAGAPEGSGTILGGTGDFVGVGGTYSQAAPDRSNDTPSVEARGPYEFEIVVPNG